MSHFYGMIKGTKGEATRCGDKGSGYSAVAAGWQGAIKVRLRHDKSTGMDHFSVYMIPWGSSNGADILLARGRLDSGLVTEGKSPVELHPRLVKEFTERLATELMLRED